MPSDAANVWATSALALISESNNQGFQRRLALAFDAGQLHLLGELNQSVKNPDVLNWVGEQIKIMKEYDDAGR